MSRWQCSLAACLTAAAAVLLCWHQRTERSVCRTLWAVESGAGRPGFMGTKTPYSILRQIHGQEDELRALESVQQDQHGCQLIKVRASLSNHKAHRVQQLTSCTHCWQFLITHLHRCMLLCVMELDLPLQRGQPKQINLRPCLSTGWD